MPAALRTQDRAGQSCSQIDVNSQQAGPPKAAGWKLSSLAGPAAGHASHPIHLTCKAAPCKATRLHDG